MIKEALTEILTTFNSKTVTNISRTYFIGIKYVLCPNTVKAIKKKSLNIGRED